MYIPNPQRLAAIRAAIDLFLQDRLKDKLEEFEKKKLEEPERAQKLAVLTSKFIPSTWLADAARRVDQIQAVTHSLKPIHPDAKGSSLYREPQQLPESQFVGSHCLGADFDADVVGNAAALDVYKFLKLSHEGHSFWDLAVKADPDFAAALSDNPALSSQWMAAFAGLAQARDRVSSHSLAKQLYWQVGQDAHDDASYHLLAPLFPTSLVHRVYQQLQDDRFSEEAKAAREARRNGTHHERPVREYPQMAIQKLGGTKPQNISQLNSERRGDNCLLASVPPIWKSAAVRPLLNINSLFKVYGRRPEVKEEVAALREFLKKNPPANMDTRQRVRKGVQRLVDEMLVFQAELLTLEPGWSQDEDCNLSAAQRIWRIWLDPDGQQPGSTAQEDVADEVAADFARWFNDQLNDSLLVGDDEFLEWRKLAKEQFAAHEREAA